KRRGGRTAEGAPRPNAYKHSVDRPDATVRMQRKVDQRQGAEGLRCIAAEDDGAAVVAVGDVSGSEHEEDDGGEERQPGEAERERGVGNLVDLPGDSDGLRLRAKNDQQAGRLVEAEVARKKRAPRARAPRPVPTLCHIRLWLHI